MGYVWITTIGIMLTLIMTVLGSSVVFLFKGEISPKINAVFAGFASGVMLAASVWSLLLPALEQGELYFGKFSLLLAVAGLFSGGLFLVVLDIITQKILRNKLGARYKREQLHENSRESLGEKSRRKESVQSGKARRLFVAVTLHNIPEGLAVGFAFGAAALIATLPAYLSALGLAVGIAVQNFPEGAAVALPIKNAVKSNKKAFLWGASSGLIEPIFSLLGYFLATSLRVWQPWLLSFAAGTMLFVTAQDLIPDSRITDDFKWGTWGVMAGFALMMALDVALG